MLNSDAHLEKALEEYNDKVNRLEENGEPKELLDAYLNRGCVLSMMGSTVSAIDDFNEAISIVTDLENSGNTVDPGYFVKLYVSRGELQTENMMKAMADDYRIAASRFPELVPGSRYYDEKDILSMCINCAGDLVDAEFSDEAITFAEKGMTLVVGKNTVLHRNCYVELCNLEGQAYMTLEENEKAYRFFTEAVRVGKELYQTGQLADEMDLVYAYVSKGDMDEFFDKEEEFFADREASIELMEDLDQRGALDDTELLSNLHGEIAQAYMKKGKMKEAEKHLLKQVSYNLSGSTEYLNENGGPEME